MVENNSREKSESRIQQEIVIWYTNTHCLPSHNPRCLIAHIPNEQQQHLIGVGVLPGFSDLIVLHGANVLFIEVKTATGTIRPTQRVFEQRVTALGYKYALVRSLEEFKAVIAQY